MSLTHQIFNCLDLSTTPSEVFKFLFCTEIHSVPYPSNNTIGGTGESLDAGGGSGGSIWVEVETLNGDGLIDVEGGAGANDGGGGGAGGRVAIYYTINHYTGRRGGYLTFTMYLLWEQSL